MHFDPTITAGTLMHAVVMCLIIAWVSGRAFKKLTVIESKTDALLNALLGKFK